jgi:hypothetical protein
MSSLLANTVTQPAAQSDLGASSRKTRIPAEEYSSTPHKGIRSLTTKLPKSAVSGRELAKYANRSEEQVGFGISEEEEWALFQTGVRHPGTHTELVHHLDEQRTVK